MGTNQGERVTRVLVPEPKRVGEWEVEGAKVCSWKGEQQFQSESETLL